MGSGASLVLRAVVLQRLKRVLQKPLLSCFNFDTTFLSVALCNSKRHPPYQPANHQTSPTFQCTVGRPRSPFQSWFHLPPTPRTHYPVSWFLQPCSMWDFRGVTRQGRMIKKSNSLRVCIRHLSAYSTENVNLFKHNKSENRNQWYIQSKYSQMDTIHSFHQIDIIFIE